MRAAKNREEEVMKSLPGWEDVNSYRLDICTLVCCPWRDQDVTKLTMEPKALPAPPINLKEMEYFLLILSLMQEVKLSSK